MNGIQLKSFFQIYLLRSNTIYTNTYLGNVEYKNIF